MQEKILLIGGGGHCKSCIDVIEQDGMYSIAGIIDVEENIGKEVLGYPIIGCDSDLPSLYKRLHVAHVSLGHIKSSDRREEITNLLLEIGYELPIIKSPFSYVSKHSVIYMGTIIMHHSVVNAGAKIGAGCIINTKALIEHDAVIDDFCHISTAAVVNGGVTVKRGTFFGSNATSTEYSSTNENDFIKANSILKGRI